MNAGRIVEFVIAVVLVVAAILLVNPFEIWMPTMVHMTMLAIVVGAVGGISTFMLREASADERDDAHRASAGRAAFMVGSGLLLLGIAIQSFGHALDPWLVASLTGMVVAKVGWRWWCERVG